MAEDEDDLCPSKGSEKQCGVILGFWDQEKTPALIEDLEHSVNLIEVKCKKLLKQLIYYRKYLEELDNPQSVKFLFGFKGKQSKSEKSFSISESDPDIKSRKCRAELEEVEEIFQENFQRELTSIHRQLSRATEKIGLKGGGGFLFPTDDYVKALNSAAAARVCGSCLDLQEDFVKKNRPKVSAKSEPAIPDLVDSGFSKITRNQLGLYQNLSWLNFPKGGTRGRPREVNNGKKASRRLGRRVSLKCRFRKGGHSRRGGGKKSGAQEEVQKRRPMPDKKVKFGEKTRSTSDESRLGGRSRPKMSEADGKNLRNNRVPTLCSVFADALGKKVSSKSFGKGENGSSASPAKVEDASHLASFARKVIPFTFCSSTSKSFNIGMNIQQFLSRSRYCKAVGAGGRGCREAVAPKAGQDVGGGHGVAEGGGEGEGKERAGVAQRCERKRRTRFTRISPESYLEYHKSTRREFTNGERSLIKSESKRAYAVGSKIMVSGCETTDYFQIGAEESFLPNDSGHEFCHECSSKLSTEWTKVYVAFSHAHRKYEQLKKQMENADPASSEADLETLGNEIDYAINKYKEFLQFYSKFLHLRHRLKSLKIACEAKSVSPATCLPSCEPRRRRPGSCRTTAMKEAFRHVQNLHKEIRLVNDV